MRLVLARSTEVACLGFGDEGFIVCVESSSDAIAPAGHRRECELSYADLV